MYSGHRNQRLHPKSGRSKEKVRLIDRERPENVMQEPFTRPRRSRMSSMSFDDEFVDRHRVPIEASTSSEDSTQVEGEDSQESDQNDDALGKDVEITEGGWICRVERFQMYLSSRGRIRFRHLRPEHSSPIRNQDMADPRKPETLDQDKVEKKIQQSIISCIYHTDTIRDGHEAFTVSGTDIEIKSPLILEILRENTSHGQEV